MNMLYLDASGVILAILALQDPPPTEFAIRQLVPDASGFSVGQNLYNPLARPVEIVPVEPVLVQGAPRIGLIPVPDVVEVVRDEAQELTKAVEKPPSEMPEAKDDAEWEAPHA